MLRKGSCPASNGIIAYSIEMNGCTRGAACERQAHPAGTREVGHELGVGGLQDHELELLLAAAVAQHRKVVAQAHVHLALACQAAQFNAPRSPALLGNVKTSIKPRGAGNALKMHAGQHVPKASLTCGLVLAQLLHVAVAGLREDDVIPKVPHLLPAAAHQTKIKQQLQRSSSTQHCQC